jgi:predicted nucleic acid-binding protein
MKRQTQIVARFADGGHGPLTASLAIATSNLSIEHALPMADSISLATGQEFKAILWTQDSDLQHINNVKYFPKR